MSFSSRRLLCLSRHSRPPGRRLVEGDGDAPRKNIHRIRTGRRLRPRGGRPSADVVLDGTGIDRTVHRGAEGTMSEQTPDPESESELIRVRREKLARIVALGYDAFPTKARADTTIAAVVNEFGGKTTQDLETSAARVAIAGRIMAIREFGKTAFLVLSEGTARIQV